ncbi:stage 0 sporulation protein [Gemella sp. GH3]|uniref:PSP1 domain-containing protein n=1 Tax=unclassified Gemella TaxID=2624949 RepID=UPI0015D063EE|nr:MULTISPECIES: regulatory iron-sulfur-containing complex subunit RicT [unclassified Gemella]MBF0714456.1 stage 0 sporulation protein [Gemella sp. GH3.1]NYS51408.1 stage 0 sporulation protein [Gemella sp. GH3]
MNKIIGTSIYDKFGVYYIRIDSNLNLNVNDKVIVSDNFSIHLAEVISCDLVAEEDVYLDNYNFLRVADNDDIQKYEQNKSKITVTKNIVRDTAKLLDLDIEVISASYSLDNKKLYVAYYSENRVDFRELLKELAIIFKLKIELYQVSDREYSKVLGGIGPCGKPICCSTLLNDFCQVSIKMVKEQNLNLNMSKVNGLCGKLKCCLQYENDFYMKLSESLPNIGENIVYKDINYIVEDIEPMKEIVIAKNEETGSYTNISITEFIEEYR